MTIFLQIIVILFSKLLLINIWRADSSDMHIDEMKEGEEYIKNKYLQMIFKSFPS